MRRQRWRIILIIGIVALSLWSLYPPKEKIHLGLDLLGGMDLLLAVDTAKLPPNISENDAVDQALTIIRNRIDQFGVNEPLIQKQGRNWIAIQLPGIKDPQRAIDIIGKTALLEFKLVDEKGDPEAIQENTSTLGLTKQVLYDKEGKVFVVKREALMTGAGVTKALVQMDEYGRPSVGIEFNSEGGKQFAKVTRRYVGERIAIILDSKVQSAPVVQQEITGGKAVITGKFTIEEANDLSTVLKAGALPAPVTIIQQRQVGPTLGEDSIRKGLFSMLLGIALVMLFVAVYYKLSGFVADFALFLNLIILIGTMAGFKATLTLPGIAGIILSLAMAVDANVLIYERIREEIKGGKNPYSAIAAGYAKAFPAIFDSNLTTLITALLIFQFGTGPLKGFAITLTLGILISMFTAIVVTRVVFDETIPADAEKISI